MGDFLRRDANARVYHFQLDAVVRLVSFYHDAAIRWGVIDGVFNQIDQRTFELIAVGAAIGRRPAKTVLETDVFALQPWAQLDMDFINYGAHINRLEVHFRQVFQPRNGEHILDIFIQQGDLRFDLLQRTLAARRIWRMFQQIEGGIDDSQRGLKVMRDSAEEIGQEGVFLLGKQ